LHIVLLLAHLLNARFQAAMKTVAAKSGCSLSQAPAKGYARARVKLDADYRTLQSPRAAWIMDPLRCLLTGPGVLSMHAAIAETNAAFKGTLQVKNPFAMDEAARSLRDHLLLLNMLVVFAPKLTFGELMAEPATAPIIADLRSVRDNEPTERWHRHNAAAVAVLKDASLADVPVQIAAEVQATFDAFGEAREQMHSAYVLFLCRRSDLCPRFLARGMVCGGAPVLRITQPMSTCYHASRVVGSRGCLVTFAILSPGYGMTSLTNL
jgi:hypothetical protein